MSDRESSDHSNGRESVLVDVVNDDQAFIDVDGSDSVKGDGSPPQVIGISAASSSSSANGTSAAVSSSSQYSKKKKDKKRKKHSLDHHDDEEEQNLLDIDVGKYGTMKSNEELGGGSGKISKKISTSSSSSGFGNGWSKTETLVYFTASLSILGNIALLIVKIYATWVTHSLAIAASLVDTLLDLVSQGIISCALYSNVDVDEEEWPVGKSRLEPIGIIVTAALMGLGAIQVMYLSFRELVEGILYFNNIKIAGGGGGSGDGGNSNAANNDDGKQHFIPYLDDTQVALMLGTIGLKVVLYLVCIATARFSPSIHAIAEDHRNDILSNSVAVVCAYVAFTYNDYWFVDSLGGIVISLYISYSWYRMGMEQVAYLVGKRADAAFLEEITQFAENHHDQVVAVDIIRAYHFGRRYLVECEIVLPKQMNIQESHDISLSLQQAIEKDPRVERAFVHVDFRKRDHNEHKRSVMFETNEEDVHQPEVVRSTSSRSSKY